MIPNFIMKRDKITLLLTLTSIQEVTMMNIFKQTHVESNRGYAEIGKKTGKNTETIKKLLLIVSLLLFAICSTVQDVEAKEKTDEKIILVYRRTNYAWGACDNGIFINEKGEVYSFDMCELGYYENGLVSPEGEWLGPDDEAVIENLYEIQKDNTTIGTVDKLDIVLCDILGKNIDENSSFEEEWTACDYGQDTLYYLDDDKLIEVSSSGDYTRHRNDLYAKMLERVYMQMQAEML